MIHVNKPTSQNLPGNILSTYLTLVPHYNLPVPVLLLITQAKALMYVFMVTK